MSSFQSHSSNEDFYVGQWEISILGTPQGDSKMTALFTREEGKLKGELRTAEQPDEVNPITEIEEDGDHLTIYFSAGGYDLSIPFEKVDNDNLKGQLMGMFDCTAVRMK